MVTTGKTFDVVIAQSDRRGWENAHLTGIGASQIAAVLGEHPYQSGVRIWGEKVGRLEPQDFTDNEAVQIGIELEPFVAQKYQQRTGRTVDQAGELLRSRTYPWAICTPDYWLMDDAGHWSIPLQIKTTGAFRIGDWAAGPPAAVFWQVQHEMLVTGAPWASVGVLVGGQRFLWADVERDDDAIGRIIKAGESFWQNVVDEVMPELDGSSDSTAVLATLYPTSQTGEVIALPDEAIEWDVELAQLDWEKSQLETKIDALKNNLRAAIGDAEAGMLHDGSGGYTNKAQTRWSYSLADGQAKPTANGETVQAVAKSTSFRVLRRSTKGI